MICGQIMMHLRRHDKATLSTAVVQECHCMRLSPASRGISPSTHRYIDYDDQVATRRKQLRQCLDRCVDVQIQRGEEEGSLALIEGREVKTSLDKR